MLEDALRVDADGSWLWMLESSILGLDVFKAGYVLTTLVSLDKHSHQCSGESSF